MTRTRLICIGACAIDTILTVPHFPEEDSKLRAVSFARRRGGNSPNTLEVLQQLIEDDCNNNNNPVESPNREQSPEMFLVAALPAKSSADTALIQSSFQLASSTSTSNSNIRSRIRLSSCVYREAYSEAVTSYIISSRATSSRTIINHNALAEMTLEELIFAIQDPLNPSSDSHTGPIERMWFHFEGRIPSTTLGCIRYLRDHGIFNNTELMISVELEKPGREGLQELAYEADVVFYSKAWAKGEGYLSAQQCLEVQSRLLSSSSSVRKTSQTTLICTWGEQGASASLLHSDQSKSQTTHGVDLIYSPAYIPDDQEIVDSTGAGDTFNAGILFGLICRARRQSTDRPPWSLGQTLSFANSLAGRKILQEGFGGLGSSLSFFREELDRESRRSQSAQ